MKRMTESPNFLVPAVVPDPRGVCVATLYTRGGIHFINLVVGEVVDKKHLLNLNNFDGQIFQWLYSKAKLSGSVDCLLQYLLSEESLGISQEFFQEMEQIYNFVTSNGRNIKPDVQRGHEDGKTKK